MSRVTLYGKGTAMLERLKTILKDLGPGWNVEYRGDHFAVISPQDDSVKDHESLKSSIKSLQSRSALDYKSYVPLRDLYRILTVKRIAKVLSEAACVDTWNVDGTAERVSKEGLRIFSILVLSDLVASARSFFDSNELKDHLLPFEKETVERHVLSKDGVQDFLNIQYELLPLEISYGTLLQSTFDQAAMPFVLNKPLNNARGTSGTIYQIAIDSRHQYLEKAFLQPLVRKEVVSTPTNHTELKNLAILNHLQHPNIAKLLACYSYQYKINLIFPLAEQGTLRDLLNADRGHITDELKDFTVDYKVLRALAGLSSALDSVHNYVNHKIDLRLSGLHHDLNPKNVLISRSTFLLGDFGLSRFKDVLEPSRTLWRDTLGYYAAPECLELDTMKKPLIGRKSEIWAFGCMLADIAIWMLFGPAGILEFTSTRKFSAGAGVTLAVFHHGIGAKNPVVEEWTRKLHNQAPHSWQPLIALIERMLSIDEACRPNSTQVTVQLQMITIATILEDINRTFTTSISEDASLDARIEHWRLQAWADTMNVHQPEAWNSQALDRVRRDQAFEHSIRHLCNILDVLGQIQHVDKRFRMIAHTIDQLANTLDTPQRTQMNMKFRDLVLNDSNVATLDAFQQLEVKDGLERDLRLQITLKFMSQKVATHANFGEESQKLDVGSIVNRDDQHAESTSGDRDLEGNPEDKNHFTTAEFRMHGTVTKILIEWRSYVQSPADEEIHKELFTRVNSVAYIMGFDKPSHLRLLNCRGYFHEESKTAFGMVYDFPEPTATAQNWEVVNLLKIFSQTTKKETQPPLNHRFKLAILLARAIFEFHKVGWVHKNIASSNVVFFSESATPHGQRVAEPYLTGFHHCRPDEPEGFSEGIPKNIDEDYQHPEYLRNRSGYVSEYDYYSLGLVLLEIGYWRPLSLLKVNKYSGDERCEKILEQTAPLLVQYMGIEYAEAVRACLDGSVARDSFDTKVLGRLTGVTLSEFSSWHTL